MGVQILPVHMAAAIPLLLVQLLLPLAVRYISGVAVEIVEHLEMEVLQVKLTLTLLLTQYAVVLYQYLQRHLSLIVAEPVAVVEVGKQRLQLLRLQLQLQLLLLEAGGPLQPQLLHLAAHVQLDKHQFMETYAQRLTHIGLDVRKVLVTSIEVALSA